MKKIHSFLLSIALCFLLVPCSVADASVASNIMDWSGRTVITVSEDDHFPVESSHEFIARYCYALGESGEEQPYFYFWDLSSVYGTDAADNFGYYYRVSLGDCTCYYDQNMHLLYYSISFFKISETEEEGEARLQHAVKAIACLEYGYSDVVTSLLSLDYTSQDVFALKIILNLYNTVMDHTYEQYIYKTADFAYYVDRVDVPEHDQEAYTIYDIYAFPI